MNIMNRYQRSRINIKKKSVLKKLKSNLPDLDIGKMITKSANPSPSDQLTIVPAIQVLSIIVLRLI